MSSRNIFPPLTSITSIYKFVCIFEKSGLIESTLQDFLCSSIRAKVTPHLFKVAILQDGMSFLFRNAPPNNFITANSENVRFLAQVILNIRKEFLSLCIRKVWRKHITCKVIHKICIPGYYGSCKKIFIRKYFLDCFFFSLEHHGSILERWSIIRFSNPFLSLISKSNSWRSNTHLMSQGFASCFANRYLMAK